MKDKVVTIKWVDSYTKCRGERMFCFRSFTKQYICLSLQATAPKRLFDSPKFGSNRFFLFRNLIFI